MTARSRCYLGSTAWGRSTCPAGPLVVARPLLVNSAAMTRLNRDTITSVDSTVRETEAELERSREKLVASLGALREEITDLVDWREWIRRRPTPFVAGAFALGLWFGWRASGHR